jgi:hypothetical protein
MSIRGVLVAVGVLGALVAPAVASAGGWATVGLDPLPHDVRAGQPWNVELTVLQHGRTPLEGVTPSVLIRPVERGPERTFPATRTGRPGVYRARVVFPAGGVWVYAVDDGFAARHAFGTLRVAGGATTGTRATAPGSDGSALPWTWPSGVAAVVAGLGVALLTSRWRRTTRAVRPG